jgi:hypothetical protein
MAMPPRFLRIVLGPLIAAAPGVLAGCADAPPETMVVTGVDELPTLEKTFAHQLRGLQPGMTLAEFHTHFPDAVLAARENGVEAYELRSTTTYITRSDIYRHEVLWGDGRPPARTHVDRLWFYFVDGLLSRWGRPDDWR